MTNTYKIVFSVAINCAIHTATIEEQDSHKFIDVLNDFVNPIINKEPISAGWLLEDTTKQLLVNLSGKLIHLEQIKSIVLNKPTFDLILYYQCKMFACDDGYIIYDSDVTRFLETIRFKSTSEIRALSPKLTITLSIDENIIIIPQCNIDDWKLYIFDGVSIGLQPEAYVIKGQKEFDLTDKIIGPDNVLSIIFPKELMKPDVPALMIGNDYIIYGSDAVQFLRFVGTPIVSCGKTVYMTVDGSEANEYVIDLFAPTTEINIVNLCKSMCILLRQNQARSGEVNIKNLTEEQNNRLNNTLRLTTVEFPLYILYNSKLPESNELVIFGNCAVFAVK